MFGLASALLILAAVAPGASRPAKANWVDIAKSDDGSLLQLDASTHQKSGSEHAIWLKLTSPVANTQGVKTSTSLVWLNCKDLTYNLMVHREDDARGARINQRVYGDKGRGFEKVKSGTAVGNVQSIICG